MEKVEVLPVVVLLLFDGREKSVRALEEVMRRDTFILLATQKNASDDDPATDAIFAVGTLASVLQLVKLPDGTAKLLVDGSARAKILKYNDRTDYYEADAVALPSGSRPSSGSSVRLATASHAVTTKAPH